MTLTGLLAVPPIVLGIGFRSPLLLAAAPVVIALLLLWSPGAIRIANDAAAGLGRGEGRISGPLLAWRWLFGLAVTSAALGLWALFLP